MGHNGGSSEANEKPIDYCIRQEKVVAWKRMESLEVEPMGLSEGLLWNVIEKKRPRMAPRILA